MDYITCPLKLRQDGKEERPKLTAVELYCEAAREGLYTFFSSVGIKKSYKQSMSDAISKFGHHWIKNSDRVEFEESERLIAYEGRLLATRIETIYDRKRDEVVAVNFPLRLTFPPDILIEDSVDVLIINREKGHYGKTTYRAVCFEEQFKFDNNRYAGVRSAVFRLAIQRYLGREKYRNFEYELRPLQGVDKILKPGHNYYNIIRELAKTIIIAKEANLFYPTNNKEACKVCVYKNTCNLSLIKE